MSGSGRKRSSKWDTRDRGQYDDERIQNDNWPEKSGRSYYHREAGHGWQSPEVGGSNVSKWSNFESNDPRSKRDMVVPAKETFSGSRGPHKNEKFDKEHNKYVENSMQWGDKGDYGSRMSPGLEEWRQQSHSQSPKSGWNRRDRSRSRSRSRGQSRSPAHSLRRDSGNLDRNRSRSVASNQLCKDFSAGRCRRGNNCPFLHDAEEMYDDYWDNRPRKEGSSKFSGSENRDYAPKRLSLPCNDFAKGRCRRGSSCRFEHHNASDEFVKTSEGSREKETDRRRRDTSADRVVEHEYRRSSDVPCRFFASGNCRNGNSCRFSHHTRGYSSPDRKSQDKWASGDKSDEVNQAWDGPTWNDKALLPDPTKLSGAISGKNGAVDRSSANWLMNDRLRNSMNNENVIGLDPDVRREATENIDKKEPLQLKRDGSGISLSISELRHGEKWIEDMDMSPDWNYKIPASNVVKEDHGQISCLESFKDTSAKNSKQGVTERDSIRFNGTAAAVQQPTLKAVPFFQAKPDLRDDTSTALQYDDKRAVRKDVNPRTDLNISVNVTSTQRKNQNGMNASVLPFSSTSTSTSMVEPSHIVIPREHQGLSLVGNPQNNVLSVEGRSVMNSNFQDVNLPQLNAGMSLAQKLVSSENLTLTNLSSSLVQLLGTGQPLPQIYAALNPNNATVNNPTLAKAEGSAFQASSSIPQPDPVIGLRNHYDPMHGSKESPAEVSNNTSGVLLNTEEKTISSDGKPEIHLKNSAMSSFPPSLPDEFKRKKQSLTSPKPDTNSGAGNGKIEPGLKENKKAREENNKVEETDPLDGEEKDGKKNKDLKGIRVFKFALVEYVKELLKPSWKEGQINKDIYKTIVKKVVDKVTATVQAGNIPQTQEKIDHYLVNSKEKLTKLVQAYVEKNQKA